MKLAGRRDDVDIALSDTAIDWLVKLHSGRATDADRASFATWRQQGEEFERAAREAEALWHGVGMAGDHVRGEQKRDARAKLTRRAVLGGVGTIGIGIALIQSDLIGPHLFADHATGVGEQRRVVLSDGSVVSLNADTSFSIDFKQAERRLRLHAGEATFDVVRDPARPFIVEAAGGWTRAIGTVFDVDIRPDEVFVTVLEGEVEVGGDAGGVLAHADQRIRYAPHGQPSTAETINADMETAWRRGRLIFNHRPLGDVVAEIERHRRGSIVITSGRLRALAVTGVFDLNDPESILRTIEETLPVRVMRLPFVTVIS